MAEKQGIKQIAANRQARHEYFVEESMEAGIELLQLRKRGALCASNAHQPL